MLKNRLSKIAQGLRVQEWWQYKIPPLISMFCLVQILSPNPQPVELLQQSFLLVLWAVSAASFGYFVNDFSDIEQDNIVGKPNLVQLLPYRQRVIVFFFLGLFPLFFQWLLSPTIFSISFLLAIVQICLFVLYSVRPVRLKDRFVIGVICDALYAHVLPALIVYTVSANKLDEDRFYTFFLFIFAWQFLQGLRNILLHHLQDAPNDYRSSTNNLAIKFGQRFILYTANFFIAPVEAICGIGILYAADNQLLMCSLVSFCGVWFVRYLLSINGGECFQEKINRTNISLWILNNFYEQILPIVTLTIYLYKSNVTPVVFLTFVLLYFLLFPVFIQTFVRGIYLHILSNLFYKIKYLFYDLPKKIYWQQYSEYWKRQHESNPNIRYHFCTVSTTNHLYKTLTLYKSLLKQSKKSRLHVLLVDDAFFDREKFLDSVHFYTLQDIAQEPSAAQIVGKYAEDKDKLRWCLKPVFMHYLLRKNLVDSVLYVDNDIYFFDNFLPLFDYVGKHELWLTPHWRCMNPFIDPHVFKDNFTDGMFNAGFVGASKAGLHILEWWSMVNSYRCEKNRAEGFWDDQRYLDMLPIRFPGVGIVRHMGCNVAVWNKRDCTRVLVSNKLLIQGEFPIVFIHFTKDTMDDIAMSKYGGDPLLMPYLSEYNGSIQESKQLLGEY